MKNTGVSILAVALAVVTFSFVMGISCSSTPSHCPIPELEEYSGPKEDLLILKGQCVVPSVLEAVNDTKYKHRAAFIGFLGQNAKSEALQKLTDIVNDPEDPHRDSAIIAVFRIDNERGKRLARIYESSGGELGKISEHIIEGRSYLQDKKTYGEAVRSYISNKWAL